MLKRGWVWGVMVLAMALPVQAEEVIFIPVKIDGPVHDHLGGIRDLVVFGIHLVLREIRLHT